MDHHMLIGGEGWCCSSEIGADLERGMKLAL